MTRRWLALTLAVVLTACGRPGRDDVEVTPSFQAWDVYLDVRDAPLSAWQVELSSHDEGLQIVGVEGGEHPGFHSPPFYDPAALAGGRLALAAFDTSGGLPKGEHRIATLHVRRAGGPDAVQLALPVAAGREGQPVSAHATLRARLEE